MHLRPEWSEQKRRRLYRIALNFFNKYSKKYFNSSLCSNNLKETGSRRSIANSLGFRRGQFPFIGPIIQGKKGTEQANDRRIPWDPKITIPCCRFGTFHRRNSNVRYGN
jgi:hypothetical protein